ncbi:MAG: DUF502 domain-containing protein [Phycisphaerales bacterium]|jgi:uncharacterized membrane protein
MRKIAKCFLKGFLIFVPVVLTISIIVYVFTSLDSLFRTLLPTTIPGMGLLVTIIVIFLIGLFASNFLGKKIFSLVESIFTKVPVVKMLYNAIRDLIEAFAGEEKKFDKPVLVTLGPDNHTKIVGFMTRESLDNLGLKDHVAVYIPQSYNFAGNVLIFPKDAVKLLEIESSEAMTFIVSGGVAGKQSKKLP